MNTNYPYKEGLLLGDSTYVFYLGSTNSMTLSGLTQNTTYHLKAYEFNVDNHRINYLTSVAGAVSFKTALPSLRIVSHAPSTFCSQTTGGEVSIWVSDPDNDSSPFGDGHVISVQMSNSSGSFVNPSILADTVYTAVQSTINFSLPEEIVPGTYQLRITSTLPSLISDTVEIIVPEIPSVTITFENGLLTSNIETGNQWYRNNTLIEGATGQTFEMIQPGTFKGMIEVAGCNPVSSNEIVITGNETGVDFSTRIFPTMVRNELNIETKLSLPIVYQLINVQGRTVKTGKLTTSQTQLNINDLPGGFYFVRLRTNKQFVVKKFIKE
jgi:hypothetical protein